MDRSQLQHQVNAACRHLLNQQNRDIYTATYGCFDRRYWGWKLVDYPEATFQRNVYPLAKLLQHPAQLQQGEANVLTGAVIAGLEFAAKVQHPDGSFDQAFPNERSFGATAFLLHPLLGAYQVVREHSPSSCQALIENSFYRAAEFLYHHDETHGHIANHLAGAVLSLLISADFLRDPRYEQRADELLEQILAHQSSEGWFLEYEGADPGYQTLCLYYLAQVYQLRPTPELGAALEKAVAFLAWFAHPNGTFGGEYGSRRTAIYYPGGLALLSREFPLALSLTRFLLRSIYEDRTVTLNDVDMGNMAPLLANYVTLLEADLPDDSQNSPPLPWRQNEAGKDFPEAGLYIRGTKRYYAILGASNGGVLKVFDRQKQTLLWNDCGYVGQTKAGDFITTQITAFDRPVQINRAEIALQTPFYTMLRSVPTPFQFVLLRILNLTVMRSIWLGNMIKSILVRLLISGKRKAPLQLNRTVKFEAERVVVSDKLYLTGQIALQWLKFGQPFVAIHMASARYFEGFTSTICEMQPFEIDVEALQQNDEFQKQVII